jgi:hypothetical protein
MTVQRCEKRIASLPPKSVLHFSKIYSFTLLLLTSFPPHTFLSFVLPLISLFPPLLYYDSPALSSSSFVS